MLHLKILPLLLSLPFRLARSANNMPTCIPCDSLDSSHLLTKEQIETSLGNVKEWKLVQSDKAIEKQFTFKDFVKAMAFVDQVADVAETNGHHPDIFISYNKVTLTLSTHSIGGLTQNDFVVAEQVDGLWLI